jgi:hypothetical protein
MAKISKTAAEYVDHPVGKDFCGRCTMFTAPDVCSLVKGRIQTQGHCKHFEARTSMKKNAKTSAKDTFNFFLPLTKIDEKKRTVSGYASTPALDLDGEIVSLDAVKKALPGYWEWRNIREMHGSSAVGVAKEANVDENGLFLTAKIVDDDAWKKCVEQVYKGFSIGGRKLAKNGNKITEIEMVEISVVDRPANPECKFTVQKSASPDAAAILLKAEKTRRDPQVKALLKMAEAAIEVAKAAPGDGMQAPALAPEKCMKHGIADCSKCAMKAKKKAAKAVKAAAVKKALKSGNRLRKEAKRAERRMATFAKSIPDLGSKTDNSLLSSPSAESSFLVLEADQRQLATVAGDFLKLGKSQHRKDDTFLTLEKNMGTAGSMAYAFDSLREIQRRLLSEAKREGGDKKDAALAKRVGSICQELAAIIGQKAEHEGAEALDLTDADDLWVISTLGEDFGMSAKKAARGTDLDTMLSGLLGKSAKGMSRAARMNLARGQMKKASVARKAAATFIKEAHAMHKAAYLSKQALAKAGKKPAKDNDGANDFDHQGAMEKLQKAYSELEKVGTFTKGARINLKKAAGRVGQQGQEVSDGKDGFYEVPAGIVDRSSAQISRAGPGTTESGSAPPENMMDRVFPGKMAKGRKIFSATEVEAVARAAAAEARVEILEKMPSGPVHGRKPLAFNTQAVIAGNGSPSENGLKKSWLDGVDTTAIGSGDEELHKRAVGHLIGNMVLQGGGQSVMDPNFHGTAGAGRA